MRLTSKGQVTVPVRLRRQAGIGPQDTVEWEARPEGLLLRKATETPGRGLIDQMRRGGRVKGSTAHWLKLTREAT